MLSVLKPGDRVRIYGERSWADGVVDDVRPVGELPVIEGAPDPADVAAILREGGCGAVVVLSFDAGGVTRTFGALSVGECWFDLRGQLLRIVKRNQDGLIH